MSTHLDPLDIIRHANRPVWSVAEFAKEMGLDTKQGQDLHRLFGDFATIQELLANSVRPSRVR